ncbi:MAG: trypsin-like peptidase domain-containing protein [Anaerolineae bacterium]|nr:trypsin-like peptidase domain-containing protein [Anaerolineae bacterium]
MDGNMRTRRMVILPVLLAVALLTMACGVCPLATGFRPPEVQEIERVVTRVVEVIATPTPPSSPATGSPTPTSPSVIDIVIQPGADVETEILNAVYRKVNPSVVNITTDLGQGSGFVWDDKGHIVTNDHVVQGAAEVYVTFDDGMQIPAQVIGEDPDSDLAVVKVDAELHELRPVELGDVDDVEVGDRAIAIGNPFGLQGTLTQGIISAKGRSIPALTNFAIPEALQTDAAINPGNSGGPLLDAEGRVIGVNAQIETGSSFVRANAGIGFAIPVNIAKRVVPALIETGHYDHPYLGISMQAYSPSLWKLLGLDPDLRGVYVLSVVSGGPADQAGIRAGTRDTGKYLPGPTGPEPLYAGGDVIVAIGDRPVRDNADLLIYLFRYASPGDVVDLKVVRNGREMVIPVKLGVRPRR